MRKVIVISQIEKSTPPICGTLKLDYSSTSTRGTLLLRNVPSPTSESVYLALTSHNRLLYSTYFDGRVHDFSLTLSIDTPFEILIVKPSIPIRLYALGCNHCNRPPISTLLSIVENAVKPPSASFDNLYQTKPNNSYTEKETRSEKFTPEMEKLYQDAYQKLSDPLILEDSTLRDNYDDLIAKENYYENKQTTFNSDSNTNQPSSHSSQNEKIIDSSLDSGTQNYYLTIAEELRILFEKYPRETTLERLIPESEFVKVAFAPTGNYYAVGVIRNDNEPELLCYAVPSRYAKNPPSSLKGFTQFLPKNMLTPRGDGYFLLYQSAKTGLTLSDQS